MPPEPAPRIARRSRTSFCVALSPPRPTAWPRPPAVVTCPCLAWYQEALWVHEIPNIKLTVLPWTMCLTFLGLSFLPEFVSGWPREDLVQCPAERRCFTEESVLPPSSSGHQVFPTCRPPNRVPSSPCPRCTVGLRAPRKMTQASSTDHSCWHSPNPFLHSPSAGPCPHPLPVQPAQGALPLCLETPLSTPTAQLDSSQSELLRLTWKTAGKLLIPTDPSRSWESDGPRWRPGTQGPEHQGRPASDILRALAW